MSRRCGRLRPVVVAASLVAASTLALTFAAGSVVPAFAGPYPRVGPHQTFDGLVNGRRGGSLHPVTIFMACVGPIVPGQTGHPLADQSVEVRLATEVRRRSGTTGDAATAIEAFFGAPPPGTGPSVATSTVSFSRYGVVKSIPTSLELPCAGTGQVTFVPFPRTPPSSRAATVPVQYVGQP
jgi:hypothetical protein